MPDQPIFPVALSARNSRTGRLRIMRLTLVFMTTTILFGCTGSEPLPLRVFAAASLQELATDLATLFEQQHSVPIELNIAGSHVLANQIARAPMAGDIFLSADPKLVDQLIEAGHIVPQSRIDPWHNTLVVVARQDAPLTLSSAAGLAIADFAHLAIGDPDGVPAGRYARAALEDLSLDLWNQLEPRLVPTPDVRAALILAAADRRTLAIVYSTDVAVVSEIRVVTTLASPTPIVYSAGATTAGRRPLAKQFLDLLESDAARQLATARGFQVAPR